MPKPANKMTVHDVIDRRIVELARVLKPAQESMHESWRRSELYYQHIDELMATAGDQANPYIVAAKLGGISIHISRALDAVRSTSDLHDANEPVVHNLVDVLLGVLDLAEYLEADLGQQLTTQLSTAMQGFAAGTRQPKQF
jgi:hypothetical protein